MTNKWDHRSCWKPIPRSRRLVMDVLHWHRQLPTAAHDRLCDLSQIAAAREQAAVRIAWPVLFLKAFAIVAEKFTPLRQAFVRWPWPHLVESPHSVGMLVTHRDVDGEPWLFWSRFPKPECTSLATLQQQLDHFQTEPVTSVFKRQWLMSGLPTPLRRLIQWWNLHVGGAKRAKRAGTFVLTTLGSQGVEIQHPPAFLTGNLTFGPLDSQNRCRVTLAYDHRLLDGRLVAHILTELEKTLNDVIASELTQTNSGVISSEPEGDSPRTTARVRGLTLPGSPQSLSLDEHPTTSRPQGSLSGRNALVTGASSGIGLAIAKRLASEGVNIIAVARSREPLDLAVAELRTRGVQAIAVPTDVTDNSQLERLVETALREFGSIDILVNNAGIETYLDFHRLSLDDIEQTINVNLTSAIKLTRLVIPHMLQQKSGHVINMSSTAGKLGPPFGAAYGASKAGLINLAQTIRTEYHGTGVTATVICPGFVHASGMYEKMKATTQTTTPWFLGSTTTQKVADAVVVALRKKRRDMIINFPPVRISCIVAQMLPWLGDVLVRMASFRFLKKVARSRERTDAAAHKAA